MRLLKTLSLPIGIAALLAACAPSQSDIENSIIENYTEAGYEDISVDIEENDDGGYDGEVTFTIPETNETRNLICIVEPYDGEAAPWRCSPRVTDLEQLIVDGYSERGAANVVASLEAESPEEYTGSVDYTDPQDGRRYTHNCTVGFEGGNANWACNP